MPWSADTPIKIYYTSRTHSQLTQFISELRKPAFPPSIPAGKLGVNEEAENKKESVRHLPLSSRQKLCINPSVSCLGSVSAINDRCAELQQPKSKDRCPFMLNADNLAHTHQFRDTALATLPDIEDMYNLGKSLQVCPYYAARKAIPGAEIITLPYPLLLQKNAREALGIKLEGNVVIIDEAHNIMDAVANVHAADIRRSELRRARAMLNVYVKRFGKKLNGGNRVMVGQLGRVIEALTEWMDGAFKAKVKLATLSPVSRTRGLFTDSVVAERRPWHRRQRCIAEAQRGRSDKPVRPDQVHTDIEARLQSRKLFRSYRREGCPSGSQAFVPGSPFGRLLSRCSHKPKHGRPHFT